MDKILSILKIKIVLARTSEVHGTRMSSDPGSDFIHYTNKSSS